MDYILFPIKSIAYRYGIGQLPDEAPKGVPSLVPVLIVLRKHREMLSQGQPLDLATFISEHHIPGLPEAHLLLPVPPNWARDLLQKGRVLVMFDGFDEVPKAERPAVAKWINAQMRQYAKFVFIVASRPRAYKEQESAGRLVLSTPIWVQHFNEAQRQRFVTGWYLAQERLKARRDTPEVRKVAAERAEDLLR